MMDRMVARANPDFGEPLRRSWVRTVGIAVITVIAFAGITQLIRGSTIDEGIGDRIEEAARASAGEPVQLRDFTDFSWSQACLFPPSPTTDLVEMRYGYDWTHALSSDAVTLVFATGRSIERQTHLAPELVELPPAGGTCQPADIAEVTFRSP